MAIYRIQHSFQGTTGLPEDRYVNTFYTVSTAPFGDGEPIALAIRNFYATVHSPSSKAITDWYSGVADAPGASVKIYDMGDALPREPLYQELYDPAAMGASSSKNLPSELAVCLSYKAPALGGVPAARRRGRLYLGPFNVDALGTPGIGSQQTVDGSLCQAMVNSAAALNNSLAILGHSWAQYSPTGGVATEISDVWVDNEWDIQRRRGLKSDYRFALPL